MPRKLDKKIVMTVTFILIITAITNTVLFLRNKGKENKEFALEAIEGPKIASVQGTTITRFIDGNPKKVKEEKILGWSFMNFNVQEISAKITGNSKFVGAPEINVSKTQDRG